MLKAVFVADFRNRSAAEARLARALARLNRQTANDLIEELGEEPRVENLPIGFWDETDKKYLAVLLPLLETLFTDHAQQVTEEALVGLDFDLINRRAAEWARQYTYDFVRGINGNTRTMLREAVSDYYERGMSLSGLQDRIGRFLGPVRGEAAGVTETTRAVAESTRQMQRELQSAGLRTETIIQTSKDDTVCPICRPKQGQPASQVGWPPFHVRCRCWPNIVPIVESVT